MTREEAIEAIKEAYGNSEYTDEIIKALEQEPEPDILDKIRAEIEQVKDIMNDEIIQNDRKDLTNFVNGLNQSLCIIGKYRERGMT